MIHYIAHKSDCDYRIISYAIRRPVNTIFCCDFLLLIDVNKWINNECDECVLPYLNIRDWFARSHPSKGENHTERAYIFLFTLSYSMLIDQARLNLFNLLGEVFYFSQKILFSSFQRLCRN